MTSRAPKSNPPEPTDSLGARVRLALVMVIITALVGYPKSDADAAPPLAQWLANQRVNTCFPWFLSGIGETVVPFDPRNVNAARNLDAFDDGNALFSGTIEAVGSDSLRVQYDPARRVALFDHRSGESSEEYLVSDVAAPPRETTTADLTRIHSQRGVRLGMPFSRVVATATNTSARIVRKCGLEAVVVQSNGADCTNERDFIFKDRKLVAFGIGGNC